MDTALGTVVRAMGSVLLGFGLLSVANGALFALIGLRLSAGGVPSTTIGLVMSAYFVGLLAGSLSGDRIITRVGHIRAFAVFAAAAAVTVLLLAMTDALALWAVLRAVAGYCMAGLFMTMESWLNHRASNEIRGRTFAVYAVTSGAAAAAGPLLLNLGDPHDFELFSLAAILYAAALLPVALTRTGNPEMAPRPRLGLKRLFAISPLGVIGCLTAGLVNSCSTAWAPSTANPSVFSAPSRLHYITPIGGLLRSFVGMFSTAGIAGTHVYRTSSRPWRPRRSPCWRASSCWRCSVSSWTDGAPLTASAWRRPTTMWRATNAPAAGGLLLATASAPASARASSLAIAALGPSGLFAFIAVMLFALAAFTLHRMRRRVAKPVADQGEFVTMPQTTAVATDLDPRAPAATAAPATPDD
jgi:MFS family permease